MGNKEMKRKNMFRRKYLLFGGLLVGIVAGIIAGLVAGVAAKYAYDKYIKEKKVHKKIPFIPK